MYQSPNSPLEFLPVTRFPGNADPLDSLHDVIKIKEKERADIQAQPYRTTQLVFPNPKIKPDLVKTKLIKGKPTTFRPLDQRTVVANLNENQALVHRQGINPRSLYSDQNVSEAIYVQTGINYQQQPPPSAHAQQYQHQQPLQTPPASTQHLSAPVHRTPDSLPAFKPQNSPTYRAILEEEGPGVAMAAVQQRVQAPRQQGVRVVQQQQHHNYNLNSVGMPHDRIAQSGSFKRLMYNVMGEF
ncbi:uncharacterized protein LOC110842741 [Folsomia candida]|uniref:uncharacterized protein LOC110842741 n=1 Tax=Folsomia candida TaxID=158441 RepID=UPI000B901ED6|nr:uncharacterized protein LOC110842741 [Folsomia candida]